MPKTSLHTSELEEVAKFPQLRSAIIYGTDWDNTELSTLPTLHIESVWKIRNYNSNVDSILHTFYRCDLNEKNVHQSHPIFQDKRTILKSLSPCKSKVAQLLQDKDCCLLNITVGESPVCVDLKNEDVHGKVYKTEGFSCLSWSHDSKLIAYIAEEKRPKVTDVFAKEVKLSDDGWGEKYAYVDGWGETMEEYSKSVVAVVNVETEEVKVIKLPDDVCPGQVLWTPSEQLVGVAYRSSPFRSGFVYRSCIQSVLFTLDLHGNYCELTKRWNDVRSPRLSPDGSRVFFIETECPELGGTNPRLISMKLEDESRKVLIDAVDQEVQLEEGKGSFCGVCRTNVFPANCWTKDGKGIIFSAFNNYDLSTYVLNTESKSLRQITFEGSLLALDVSDDYLLARTSSLTQPHQLLLLRLEPYTSDSEQSVDSPDNVLYLTGNRTVDGIPVSWRDRWTFRSPLPLPQAPSTECNIPVLYMGPTEPDGEPFSKRPLIVWVHGGPHSMITDEFIPMAAYFAKRGFSLLFANYRGSVGQGRATLEALRGHIGSADVDEVHQATLQALKRYEAVVDASRVALYGGSHGGFIVTHLSAQHPELYKVVSTRNPMIDTGSKITCTDSPESNFVLSGYNHEIGMNLDTEMRCEMFKNSPLSLIDNVKAPTLILLGKNDRRIHMSQGLYYHKMLLARKVPTKAFTYDDSHALSKPEVEADCVFQTVNWFQEHL